MAKLNKIDKLVLEALKEGKELTLKEIALETDQPPKKVFKALRKLFEKDLIETNARKYKLAEVK
jgi:predicted transcriptional regulator